MTKAKSISCLLTIFVTAPIWYYLLYQVLKRVDASELMWFLFWVYMPVGILTSIVTKLSEPDK